MGKDKIKDVQTDTFLVEPLTERELEVMTLIVAGISNPGIAKELGLTLNTVKTHVRNIYGKLGVNKRVQAVNKAKELELIK